MKRFLLTVLLLTALTVGVPGQEKKLDREKLYGIEPGWRVGLIVFTMTPQQVQQVYGEGKVYTIPGGDNGITTEMLQYKQLGLEIIFKGQSMEEILISYPYYSVKGMIKVGCGVERVKEVMGDAFIRENYQHAYQTDLPDGKMIYDGITFEVKNDRVVKIIVRRKK